MALPSCVQPRNRGGTLWALPLPTWHTPSCAHCPTHKPAIPSSLIRAQAYSALDPGLIQFLGGDRFLLKLPRLSVSLAFGAWR